MDNKNVLIICQSNHHGNTYKIAKAMGEVLNAEVVKPKDVNEENLEKYELIGFGSGIYNQKHHESLFNVIDKLKVQRNKKGFIFSTASVKYKAMHEPLKENLTAKGFDIIGEFMCKGFMTHSFTKHIFGGLNKGRPNNKDIMEAREFAKRIKMIL